ncbi:MAG: RDD family protein [Actinomycetota bacterium]|nr:RDD family protein [Actinomycetota bacterium]
MRYEDSVSISTPEGVAIDMILAGLGSRFVAGLVDALIKGVILGTLFLATNVLAGEGFGGGVLVALLLALSFLINFGYDVLFEVLSSGRTPGKRMIGIRVVSESGQPVGFVASAIRNLMRLVDMLPVGYVVGSVAVLANARNQRLGDLAAGTLVVRERRSQHEMPWGPAPTSVPFHELQTWDVSAVTDEEVATVRAFLARRYELAHAARNQLADDLARGLRPRVAGAHGHLSPDDFLAALVAAKTARA